MPTFHRIANESSVRSAPGCSLGIRSSSEPFPLKPSYGVVQYFSVFWAYFLGHVVVVVQMSHVKGVNIANIAAAAAADFSSAQGDFLQQQRLCSTASPKNMAVSRTRSIEQPPKASLR